MNCEMGVWVVAADPQAAMEHLVAARDYFHNVEDQLSRFRPQSELSRLNRRPGQSVPVSPLLWQVIVWALGAAERTNGLYDPTVLDALEAAGYDRSFAERPVTNDECDVPSLPMAPTPAFVLRGSSSVPHGPTWRDVQLEPRTRSVTLPAGVRLDLGGIAKGWAADRVADRLAALGPCLVDAGGDIAARGSPPGQAGWLIGVADPQDPETDLALLLVRDRGVATSGVDYRRWSRGGSTQHHIIDPRTRRPARTDLLSVTVLAPDATQADLHALVAMILGSQEGFRYLLCHPGVEGMLVGSDGRQFSTPAFTGYVFCGA